MISKMHLASKINLLYNYKNLRDDALLHDEMSFWKPVTVRVFKQFVLMLNYFIIIITKFKLISNIGAGFLN